MLRGAVTNESACAQLREFIQSRLVHGAGDGTRDGTRDGTDDDAMLRAGLAAAMLVGIVTGRRIIGVPVLVAADTGQLVATVGPAIQRVLVGAEPSSSPLAG